MSEYKPVPVSAAAAIASDYEKAMVIVCAVDRTHDRTHFTSFGITTEDKYLAAELAEQFAAVSGHEMQAAVRWQDFRADLMRSKCLADMKLMWPHGPADREQHRDVIRIYAMGWCDALMAAGNKAAVEAWTREFAHIAEVSWFPDSSWQWW